MKFKAPLTDDEAKLACETLNLFGDSGPVAKPNGLEFFGANYFRACVKRGKKEMKPAGLVVLASLMLKLED